jgi:hypothetical protein
MKRPRLWSSWCLKDPTSVSSLALISQQKVRWFELSSSSDDDGSISSNDTPCKADDSSQNITVERKDDNDIKLRTHLSQTILSYSSYNTISSVANQVPEIASLRLCCAESVSVKSRNYASRISEGAHENSSPFSSISIRIRQCAHHNEGADEDVDEQEGGTEDGDKSYEYSETRVKTLSTELPSASSSALVTTNVRRTKDLVIMPLSPACTQGFFAALFSTGYVQLQQGIASEKKKAADKQKVQDAIEKLRSSSSSVGGFVIVHLPTSSATGGDLALVSLRLD